MNSQAVGLPAPSRSRWAVSRVRWWAMAALLVVAGGFAARHLWAWHHLSAAETALAHYQNDSALAHLEKCLSVWPDNVTAHVLAARAERRAGRATEAEEHIDLARKSAGARADAVAFEWSLLQAATGRLETVETQLQDRIKKSPAEAPLIWEALCVGYRRTYRMVEADNLLKTWLYFDPDNVQAHFLRGEAHRQLGADGLAIENYQRVVDLDPTHELARRYLARALVRRGRYKEAASHFEVLLRRSPDDPELKTGLARSWRYLGRKEEAVALLDAVLGDHPEYGPALRERGRAALAVEAFADAEAWLRKAQRALPYDYDTQFALHQALNGLGRVEDAKTELAVALLLKDRMERVSEIQSKQMTLTPFDAALHAELGGLLLDLGQQDSAERWLHSALRLDPQLASAHATLARLYDEQGDVDRAARHRRLAAKK